MYLLAIITVFRVAQTNRMPTAVALQRVLSRVPTPMALQRVHVSWFRFGQTQVWVWEADPRGCYRSPRGAAVGSLPQGALLAAGRVLLASLWGSPGALGVPMVGIDQYGYINTRASSSLPLSYNH